MLFLGYTADKTSNWDLNTGNFASNCALQKIFNMYLLNAHEVTDTLLEAEVTKREKALWLLLRSLFFMKGFLLIMLFP